VSALWFCTREVVSSNLPKTIFVFFFWFFKGKNCFSETCRNLKFQNSKYSFNIYFKYDLSPKTSEFVNISPIDSWTKISMMGTRRIFFYYVENATNGPNQPIKTKFIRFQIVLLFYELKNLNKSNFCYRATRRNSEKCKITQMCWFIE
jgi:hypothetical protein